MDSLAAAVEKIEKASISGAEKYANLFSRMPSMTWCPAPVTKPRLQAFPSCTFVPLVVNDLANYSGIAGSFPRGRAKVEKHGKAR
jgi:hypothetical protein